MKTKMSTSSESEVWNAISAFERILEAMPNDRVALETLYDAYEQIGQSSRAIEYLLRLGQVILEENDAEGAPKLLERLRAVQKDDPAAAEMADKLKMLGGDLPDIDKLDTTLADGKRRTVDISGELSLAWSLLQAGKLTQEQYSSVVHDLSECSTREQHTPVTVLHMLQGRGVVQLDQIMAHMAKDSGVPVLTMSNFEVPKTLFRAQPLDLVTTRAAIVFESMGRDALVAILNPYDKDLQEQVAKEQDKRCHFYLITPSDYDHALEDIKNEYNTVDEDAA
jgi:tetratricopeptide (TPR) repeat protein